MNYIITRALTLPVKLVVAEFKALGLPVQVVLAKWTLRSRELMAAADMDSADCRYILDLLHPVTTFAPLTAPVLPAGLKAIRRSPQLSEYQDELGRVRARVAYQNDCLWRVTRADDTGHEAQEWYDSRGFLARQTVAGTQRDLAADGTVVATTTLSTGVTTIEDGRRQFASPYEAGISAAALDRQFQPGDCLLSIWANDFFQAVADQLTQPFRVQIGLLTDQGALPQFDAFKQVMDAYRSRRADAPQKMAAGDFYYAPAAGDRHLATGQRVTARFLALKGQAAQDYLRLQLGGAGQRSEIVPPATFTTAVNTHIGENFFCNTNATFMDVAPIWIGDNARIGPNCRFFTGGHPLNAAARNNGFSRSQAIRIGHNAWLAGGVTIVGGVTLGDNVVVAAGAVVTHSFGDNVLIGGVPARVLRELDPAADEP